MASRMLVWVRTQFEGYHRWKDAPDDVKFLRDWHRHLFHVRVGVEVLHGDREVEFFQLKAQVDSYLSDTYLGQRFESSCEMIAQDLALRFNACLVEVSEDGENGATVLSKF